MVPVWDSLEQQEVLVRPYILFLPADNPMQAEQCSSTGLKSNMFCRTCNVGGPQEHKLSDDGYGQLFQVGIVTYFVSFGSPLSMFRQTI